MLDIIDEVIINGTKVLIIERQNDLSSRQVNQFDVAIITIVFFSFSCAVIPIKIWR